MEETDKTEAKERTRGRVPADAERVKTTLLLDSDTMEWSKHHPGGLSEIIRRLLRQEMGQKGRSDE